MVNEAFQWKCCPQGESVIENFLAEACSQNTFIAALAHDIKKHVSSRLFDWLDHIVIGNSITFENEITKAGFVNDFSTLNYSVFSHPGAQLPRIIVREDEDSLVGIAVSVDSIADFLMVRGLSAEIEGAPFSGYRRCCISQENKISLWIVERRGTLSVEPLYHEESYLGKYFQAVEKWQCRPRDLLDEDKAMEKTLIVAQEMVALLGKDLAASVVLEYERAYWEVRNTAGQIQKCRQDRLGLGWANHDHHTFRSSRRYFSQLVRLFEMLGFHCRERFYAGEEAGWGAQVMENPKAKLVLFLDVDLAPEELEIDFAHLPLADLPKLGTVGLWCALHGDSILKAGMHHLEAQFTFEDLTADLQEFGVDMMEPFSSFSYLKQAFTKGELWPVEERKVLTLLEKGQLTEAQAEKFLEEGALGSHMENLQRREGYKGFNQKNVSFIIKKTDPRAN